MSVSRRVEFVSYTGEYPDFCGNGILTLKIDGIDHTFGDGNEKTGLPKGEYRSFWSPGCSLSWEESQKCFDGLCVPITGEFELYGELFPDALADAFFEVAHVLSDAQVLFHCGGCR